MIRWALPFAWAAVAMAAGPVYEVSGRYTPGERAAVSLYAVKNAFAASVVSDNGKFSFRKVAPGAYTVGVYIRGRGEARTTIEVGPGTADPQNRVVLTLTFRDSDFHHDAAREHSIAASQLAVPERAVREYAEAERDLGTPDPESARRHLERAVEIAPEYAAAWNTLGTMAYKERQFARAEQCFRAALKGDPEAYEPLVNLGGVLLALERWDEALDANVRAVVARPKDALANVQLGMTYFSLRNYELARKHLEIARQADPGHFSHPQLYLAEIDLRLGNPQAAAAELADFLERHPDYPQAARIREKIAELRK